MSVISGLALNAVVVPQLSVAQADGAAGEEKKVKQDEVIAAQKKAEKTPAEKLKVLAEGLRETDRLSDNVALEQYAKRVDTLSSMWKGTSENRREVYALRSQLQGVLKFVQEKLDVVGTPHKKEITSNLSSLISSLGNTSLGTSYYLMVIENVNQLMAGLANDADTRQVLGSTLQGMIQFSANMDGQNPPDESTQNRQYLGAILNLKDVSNRASVKGLESRKGLVEIVNRLIKDFSAMLPEGKENQLKALKEIRDGHKPYSVIPDSELEALLEPIKTEPPKAK